MFYASKATKLHCKKFKRKHFHTRTQSTHGKLKLIITSLVSCLIKHFTSRILWPGISLGRASKGLSPFPCLQTGSAQCCSISHANSAVSNLNTMF